MGGALPYCLDLSLRRTLMQGALQDESHGSLSAVLSESFRHRHPRTLACRGESFWGSSTVRPGTQ